MHPWLLRAGLVPGSGSASHRWPSHTSPLDEGPGRGSLQAWILLFNVVMGAAAQLKRAAKGPVDFCRKVPTASCESAHQARVGVTEEERASSAATQLAEGREATEGAEDF